MPVAVFSCSFDACQQVVEVVVRRVGPLDDELALAQLGVDGWADRHVRTCGKCLRDSQSEAIAPLLLLGMNRGLLSGG